MSRPPARSGASVKPGCWRTQAGLVISSLLMRPGSIPRWRACGGVVHVDSGWWPQSFTGTGKHSPLSPPCAMTADIFETYIETQLVPTLNKGDVVVLDNLSAHKRKTIRNLVEARGAWFLFLPPY